MRVSFLLCFSFLIICLSESLWPPFLLHPCLYLQNQSNEKVLWISDVYICYQKLHCNLSHLSIQCPFYCTGIVITAFRGCVWICWDNWWMWWDWSSKHVIRGTGRDPFPEPLGKVRKILLHEEQTSLVNITYSLSNGKSPSLLASTPVGSCSQHLTMLLFNRMNNWNLLIARWSIFENSFFYPLF